MSWLFSRALVEASLPANRSDGTRSVQSSSPHIPQAFCAPDRMTDFSRLSRFGMTFAPSTDIPGEDVLTWCLEDSLARTSALRGRAQESAAEDPGYGSSSFGSFVRLLPNTHTWKTAQCSLLGGWESFSQTWPRWGSMRDGACWELPPLVLDTSANESGLWPTVCARDYRGIGRSRLERTGSTAGECLPQAIGGLLNPTWAEWLMGWPLGWTELRPSATDKYRSAPLKHGESLEVA